MKEYSFFVYIITNTSRRSIYIGITNSLKRRLTEHKANCGSQHTWAGRYFCCHLIYFETFKYIDLAIAREKQLKRWSRKKKMHLISLQNPEFNILEITE